ncbi:MAG: CYTH domain-containing protein, partial [Micromonosporaceae bacterium]
MTDDGAATEEYEIKSHLTVTSLDAFLALGPVGQGETRVVDTYYDDGGGSLYRAGVFVRVRNSRSVEVKWTPDPDDRSHTNSQEEKYEYPVGGAAAEALRSRLRPYVDLTPSGTGRLEDWGLSPLVTVDKVRRSYGLDGLTVCVDEVDGLGSFIEIESPRSQDRAGVAQLAQRLGMVNLPIGYV